ncbi:MAG: radical SAM family heme chaperone HemW [Gammaproteobacteria bacterium]|nr:radical SAM family heme chaperone HemW [Gammaproteobacteria bacterium]MBU2478519.1 radical SAM family heme chaperone HemW [Gammaproteobacteria bacterium]
MFHFTALPPLALYVHIPWCVRKCPYCDFNSHAAQDSLPERQYVDALLTDLDQELPSVWGRVVSSIFIGGGTPSLFSAEAIDRLLVGIRARLQCKPDLEITLEANPGTVEQGRFREFRAAGVNRLSIGVQSFNDDLLQRIGRIHGRREAIRAAELAHDAGFISFNLDLMFGLPDQTPSQALTDLATAMDLEPAHLSWYQLTLEPNTYFHHHPPELPDDEQIWSMQQQGQAQLQERDYTQYEVSAYARAGRECRHNLNYWRYGDYLGIGAGAHQKITDAAAQCIRRRWKLKNPRDYLAAVDTNRHIGGSNEPDDQEVVLEFLMNALRLNAGFSTANFEDTTGLSFDLLRPTLTRAQQRGLLQENEPWRCTEQGQRFLNDLLTEFVPDNGHA